jgi:hypothetical protein
MHTQLSDHYRIMQLTEEMISGTSASRTSALVTALVQFIIRYAHIVNIHFVIVLHHCGRG